jgi:FAD/FMN-containing dehydrogenase
MKIIHFKTLIELEAHLKTKQPTLYVGSRTSTVLPYEQMMQQPEKYGILKKLVIGDLSLLPKKMTFDAEEYLHITGAVTWQEAKAYCLQNDRDVMTSPTEELALCLSGIATSATGERCFGYGTLREQIIDVTFLNSQGEQITYDNKTQLKDHEIFQNKKNKKILADYEESYSFYKDFKNAPFPRLEKLSDLLIGTEGQLGIITAATFKTIKKKNEIYLFIKLPKWEKDFKPHLEIFNKVQTFRKEIDSCEFVDENSVQYLPEQERPASKCDLLFLEIDEIKFEKVYEELLSDLKLTSHENIFQMSSSKCRQFRMNIPRYTFERNQQMGVTKVGTDVQVRPEQFNDLIMLYKGWKDDGIAYNLFGHFGDAHLHFNFMPKPEELELCKLKLEKFYHQVKFMTGSPFAEHGIGILKKKYIKPFYNEIQVEMFKLLKSTYDPDNILFPNGFMSPK